MFVLWRIYEKATEKEDKIMTRRVVRKPRHVAATVEKPTVNIGKKGPTDFLVNEISKRLDKRKVVKVKILKTALVDQEVEKIALKVAEQTGSKIVQLRGHTFTLYRSKKAKKYL